MSSGFVNIKHLDTLYVYCLIVPLVLLLLLLILLLLVVVDLCLFFFSSKGSTVPIKILLKVNILISN